MLSYQKSCWALATVAEQTSTNKAMQRAAHIVTAVEHEQIHDGNQWHRLERKPHGRGASKTASLTTLARHVLQWTFKILVGLLVQTESCHCSRDSNPGRDQPTVELATNIHQAPCNRLIVPEACVTSRLYYHHSQRERPDPIYSSQPSARELRPSRVHSVPRLAWSSCIILGFFI